MQIDDKEILRAEADVIACYILKVRDSIPLQNPTYNSCLMQLAFILLLQRTAVVTRAGGKTKLSPSLSEAGYPSQSDYENADRLLRAIQTVDGLPSMLVDDICNIYYRNKFIGL